MSRTLPPCAYKAGLVFVTAGSRQRHQVAQAFWRPVLVHQLQEVLVP